MTWSGAAFAEVEIVTTLSTTLSAVSAIEPSVGMPLGVALATDGAIAKPATAANRSERSACIFEFL